MTKKKKRNWKAPIVLWKLYKDKARSLATTIICIIHRPPPPFTCTRCKGHSCLRCCEDPMAFLLRPHDPLDYINLLNYCFVVVNDDAPFLNFYPDQRWSQKELVVRAIEMSCQRPKPSNVICSGYNKHTKSSQIVELLTSSAWDILLGRVGDECMFYLLRHTSIFVPIFYKKHLQVVGYPVKYSRKKLPKKVNIPQSGMSECIEDYILATISFHNVLLQTLFLKEEETDLWLQISFQWRISRKLNSDCRRSQTIFKTRKANNQCHAPTMLNAILLDLLAYLSFNYVYEHAEKQNRHHSFLKLLKQLIRRARRCNHLKLLEKYCPLPSSDQMVGKSRAIIESSMLDKRGLQRSRGGVAKENRNTLDMHNRELGSTRLYCSKTQVVEFLWAVCRCLVPPDLLGTPSNWRLLKRNVFRFIQLRRFEKFSVMQCMYQLKFSDFPFLSNNHNAQVRKNGSESKKIGEANCGVNDIKHKLLVSWILWFFSSLVVPLVQANFYVTEGEHGKLNVFYYRKPVWQKFIDCAVTCLKDQSYHELDEAAVRAIICSRPFGFSKLRLCPKQNGVRMLANLNTSSKMLQERISKYRCSWMRKISKAQTREFKSNRVKSVNFRLRGIHAVLKGLLLKEPEKLGSMVFDYNDVYAKLCPFITTLKDASTSLPGVFIVAADVSNAFDSVDQDKLLRMMEDAIVKNKYFLQQNHQIAWLKKFLFDRWSLMLVDETINPGFTNLLSSVSFRSLSGVIVNQGCCTEISKQELFSDLHQLLKCNVVQLDKKFYLQKLGIPQGSILSTLLCSLYYGHMEKHAIFPYLEKAVERVTETLSSTHKPFDSSDAVIFPPTYLLLRFVDDFLFISTSKELASCFLSMLRRGFPDYNCYMNVDKFCVNFDIEHNSGISSNGVFTGEDGTSFIPWSGLLINSNTLEIQGDYTRYLGKQLSCTLTIRRTRQPGKHLKHKLCDFTRPKCHPIFFDPSINSASVVRLNVYQAFLLCAMKFHCYLVELSDFFQPRRRYCLKIILKSFRYMHRLIQKKMGSVRWSSGLRPDRKHKLVKDEVEWLGLAAYMEVLKRKQSRHKALLSMLRSKFYGHRITGNESSELRFAVERSHSSCLWRIQF
ncbi:hypothetical protein V6N13_062624 [Hibiscus sabdariffa]|uniref:Telomerase reverse transcriptase n=1 Tax=Hibiscus sabdariffa TaxID=183260 RepID=A0ABR1ZSW0_9ROSI